MPKSLTNIVEPSRPRASTLHTELDMRSKERSEPIRTPKASDEVERAVEAVRSQEESSDSRKYDVDRAATQQAELAEPVRADAREHEVEHAAPERIDVAAVDSYT